MSQIETPAPTTAGAAEPSERVARFKAEIAEMRLRDPKASRDRVWALVGLVLMVVGVIVAFAGFFISRGATTAFNSQGPAEQRDAIALAVAGVAVTVFGAAMFIRYSFAQFLRFWLARLIYEQQAQTDRIVEAGKG